MNRKRKLVLGGMILALIFVSIPLFDTYDIKKGHVVLEDDNSVTISVLAGQSTADAGIEDMIEEKIQETYPEIKLEWECVDWGTEFDERIRARFAAGDIPDIMIGKAQDVKAYVGTGNLAPIDEAYTGTIKKEALRSVQVNGKVYGLPYNAWYQGVLYHKDMFQKFDLTVPKDQQELDRTIEVLKENHVTPFAAHYQESWKIGNVTMQFMMNEIFKQSPEWGTLFRLGKVNYSDSPEVKRCMEYHEKIKAASWEDALYLDQFECDNRFTNGEAAMYLTGSWSMQFANQYSDTSEFGIFPFPNSAGDAALIRETNMTFMKSAVTPYGDIVDKILKLLISDQKLMDDILEFTQTFSVIKDNLPEFSNCIQEDIETYEKRGQVIDVTGGNTQLVWKFQNEVAIRLQQWMQGKLTLQEVYHYADTHRSESINE